MRKFQWRNFDFAFFFPVQGMSAIFSRFHTLPPEKDKRKIGFTIPHFFFYIKLQRKNIVVNTLNFEQIVVNWRNTL